MFWEVKIKQNSLSHNHNDAFSYLMICSLFIFLSLAMLTISIVIGLLELSLFSCIILIVCARIFWIIEKKENLKKLLKRNEIKTEGRIIDFICDHHSILNGFNPYKLEFEWIHPTTKTTIKSQSKPFAIWCNPKNFIDTKKATVDVFVDPNDLNQYYISIDKILNLLPNQKADHHFYKKSVGFEFKQSPLLHIFSILIFVFIVLFIFKAFSLTWEVIIDALIAAIFVWVYTKLSGYIFNFFSSEERTKRYLEKIGNHKVKGIVTQISWCPNMNMRIKSKRKTERYRIDCKWNHPSSNQVISGSSFFWANNPQKFRHIQPEAILPVLIDPKDPKRYYICKGELSPEIPFFNIELIVD